jgi:hypothetical protein
MILRTFAACSKESAAVWRKASRSSCQRMYGKNGMYVISWDKRNVCIYIYHYLSLHNTIYNVKWDSIYILCELCVCAYVCIMGYYDILISIIIIIISSSSLFYDRSTGMYVHTDWNIQHYLTKNIVLGLLVCSLAIKLGNGKFPN